ncbi:MAG: hypothetical protein ACO1OB_28025 [Archangium sp.]
MRVLLDRSPSPPSSFPDAPTSPTRSCIAESGGVSFSDVSSTSCIVRYFMGSFPSVWSLKKSGSK